MKIEIENRELAAIIEPIVRRAVAAAMKESRGPQLAETIGVDELCAMAQHSKQWCYQLNSQGQIPGATKVGCKLRFRTDIVRDWIAAGCPKSEGGPHYD